MKQTFYALCTLALVLCAACTRPQPPAEPAAQTETQALVEMQAKVPLSKETFSQLLVAARSGDGEAQVIVGLIYASGYGTAKNFNEASRWLRRAQSAGNEDAAQILPHLHHIMREESNGADVWINQETQRRLAELARRNEKNQP